MASCSALCEVMVTGNGGDQTGPREGVLKVRRPENPEATVSEGYLKAREERLCYQ